MNGVLERTLGILEVLCQHGEGMELAAIADQLGIPRSAVHRLLADLMRCGYVRQTREHGEYLLTTKLIAMGLSFLSNSGIVDISQPLLDRLAENEKNGVVYHRKGITGDYDDFDDAEKLIEFIKTGKR